MVPHPLVQVLARGHAVDYFDASKAVPKLKKILWVSKLVNRLLSRPPTILDHYAVGYATPLHLAAYNGNIGAVDLLLGAGADVASTRHPLRMTPLHAAAAAGNPGCIESLLNHKDAADLVMRPDGQGKTALRVAVDCFLGGEMLWPSHWSPRCPCRTQPVPLTTACRQMSSS